MVLVVSPVGVVGSSCSGALRRQGGGARSRGGRRARRRSPPPRRPSLSPFGFSVTLFFLFFLLARAPGHSPRPLLPFFSFLARAQSGIGGGEGGIPSKESLGAILERRGGEPHIDRPTKKRKALFPPSFQNGTGSSSPLLAFGSLEQLWKVVTLRPRGGRQKRCRSIQSTVKGFCSIHRTSVFRGIRMTVGWCDINASSSLSPLHDTHGRLHLYTTVQYKIRAFSFPYRN